MKKVLSMLLVLCMVLGMPVSVFAESATLEALIAASGLDEATETITLTEDVTWTTGAGHGSTPLVPADNTVVNKLIIDGNNSYTLTAIGQGVGSLRAANGATLVFKNMTIVDNSVSYAEDSWEFGYLEFGGKLEFENCKFENAIMMESESAVFDNCTFNSHKDNEYAVWVSDGTVSFNKCLFEGARGLKAHEAYGSEVASIAVDSCTFNGLTKKPGAAFGDLNANTTISFTNNHFIGCQAGDQSLFMYESDTDVSTFTFTAGEDNCVADAMERENNLYKCPCCEKIFEDPTAMEPVKEETKDEPIIVEKEETYKSVIAATSNGSVKVDSKKATRGEKVTITVTPDKGYELAALSVIDEDGNERKLTENENGTFSFRMPEGGVTIEAEFAKIGASTSAPSTEKENPSTGASDFVGAAAALAVVSVMGMAALSLKK